MSYVSESLDGESGIQYTGIDTHQKNNISPLTNMLMLVENVPRGRVDKAMTVTLENMNLILGRQVGNLYLKAVQDSLNVGVSSVQVLRVSYDDFENIDNGILQENSDSFVLTEEGAILLRED